jgi:hypothetical protein
MVIETDAAYIAGLFDGEGHVHIATTAQGGFVAFLTISNTNKDVLKWVQSVLGGGVSSWQPKGQRATGGAYRRIYQWAASSRLDMANALFVMLPYSKIKRDELRVLWQYTRVMHDTNQRLTDADRLVRLALVRRLKELHESPKIRD